MVNRTKGTIRMAVNGLEMLAYSDNNLPILIAGAAGRD